MKVLIEELASGLDAFDIYSVFKEDKTVTFLDSSMTVDQLGRYSIIGLNPFTTFKFEDNTCYIDEKRVDGNPLDMLKKLLSSYKVDNETYLPYVAGAIGFFSYDFGRTLEDIPTMAEEDVKNTRLLLLFL